MAPEFLVVGERDKRGQHGLYERALSLPSLGSTFARYRGAPGSRCGSAPRAGSAGLKTKRMIVPVQQPRPPPGWAEPERPSPNRDPSSAAAHPGLAVGQGAEQVRTGTAHRSSGRSQARASPIHSNRGLSQSPSRMPGGRNHHGIPRQPAGTAGCRLWRAGG